MLLKASGYIFLVFFQVSSITIYNVVSLLLLLLPKIIEGFQQILGDPKSAFDLGGPQCKGLVVTRFLNERAYLISLTEAIV